MKIRHSIAAVAALGLATVAFAQQEAAVTLDGKKIVLKLAAPDAKTRAVANLHSDADLAFKGFVVPKGDYTVVIQADGVQWQLAVNKASGESVGKLPMTMGKPAAASNGCNIALTKTAMLAAKIEVTWNGALAAVPFHLDRGAADSEW